MTLKKMTEAESLEAYEKHKASLRKYHKRFREAAPILECECGFVTKSYLMNSHVKSARHQKKLEDRKQMQAARATATDLCANSSIPQGGNTAEAKI